MHRIGERFVRGVLLLAVSLLLACDSGESRRLLNDGEADADQHPDAEAEAEEQGLCGNGQPDPGEACEPGQRTDCVNLGGNYTGGEATCESGCRRYDTRLCLTDGREVCGNGVKEGLEACDRYGKPCTEIGEKYTGGTAECRSDCVSYDVSGCETAIQPYGLLNGQFTSGYLLDDTRLGDKDYVAAHADGIQRSAAFSGTYGSSNEPIPGDAATSIVTYALRSERKQWLYVLQDAYDDESKFVGPRVELHFSRPTISTGRYVPNMHLMGATRLYLWDFDSAGSMVCLRAIGIGGVIEVTLAENTAAADGGKLAFNAKDVVLYHVRNTPYGQQTIDTFGASVNLCPLD